MCEATNVVVVVVAAAAVVADVVVDAVAVAAAAVSVAVARKIAAVAVVAAVAEAASYWKIAVEQQRYKGGIAAGIDRNSQDCMTFDYNWRLRYSALRPFAIAVVVLAVAVVESLAGYSHLEHRHDDLVVNSHFVAW